MFGIRSPGSIASPQFPAHTLSTAQDLPSREALPSQDDGGEEEGGGGERRSHHASEDLEHATPRRFSYDGRVGASLTRPSVSPSSGATLRNQSPDHKNEDTGSIGIQEKLVNLQAILRSQRRREAHVQEITKGQTRTDGPLAATFEEEPSSGDEEIATGHGDGWRGGETIENVEVCAESPLQRQSLLFRPAPWDSSEVVEETQEAGNEHVAGGEEKKEDVGECMLGVETGEDVHTGTEDVGAPVTRGVRKGTFKLV